MIGYPDLQWFPKPFGAGDTDGAGSKRMLGQPEVDPPNLLVREMAQNSWDAKLTGVIPSFDMRFRILDDTVRDVLKWNVFGGKWSDNLGLAEALANSRLCAVEVSDRGTKGLGGPIRNDIDPAAGESTDYADFVLTIGAPPEHAYGGGTYGFGKTAAYLASECSTIVIWSRARGADGSLSERFIASAMGSRFTADGQRYTGRQWWGIRPDVPETNAVFRVEPAIGEDARQLGEALFESAFEGDETGTSILILQPKGHEEADALIDSWGKAITRNLWPKLDRAQAEERRMNFRLVRDGVEIQLPSRATSTTLDAATRCLDVLRRAHTKPFVDDPLVKLEEIWCGKPRKLLGHLALTKFLSSSNKDNDLAVDSITYMRNAAELVVRDEYLGPTVDGLTQWVGVFKPNSELDPVFAAAEPPAHDSWNPNGLDDRNHRTFVKLALQRTRESANSFRNPVQVDTDANGSSSTGKLSAALAGLAGSASGSRATPRPSTASSVRSATRPKVDILGVVPLPPSSADLANDRQTTRVNLAVSGSRVSVPIRPASLSVAVDGGVMASEGQVVLEQWAFGDGAVFQAPEVVLAPGQSVFADISYPVGLAIEFSFTVGEV